MRGAIKNEELKIKNCAEFFTILKNVEFANDEI
jgi:hypothetical protein